MDNENKHTPGPWKVHKYHTIWTRISAPSAEGERNFVCLPPDLHQTPRRDKAETMANAYLIAAAPELLAVCQYLLSDFHMLTARPVRMYSEKRLKQAVAKATGVEFDDAN